MPPHELQPPGWPKVRPRLSVDVRDEATHTWQTALHVAARKNDTVVIEALLAVSATLDPEDSAGRTPLGYAAAAGSTAAARVLLDAGACLEPADARISPLHSAVRHSHPETVRLLCAAGKFRPRLLVGIPSLLLACCDSSSFPERLLVRTGARLDDGTRTVLGTPLHQAARRHAVRIRDFRDPRVGENPAMDVVEALLEAGAAVDARDMAGQAPLHLAVRTGCAEQDAVVRALLRAGADPALRDDPPKGAAATAAAAPEAGVTPLEAAREALAEHFTRVRGVESFDKKYTAFHMLIPTVPCHSLNLSNIQTLT